MTDRKSKQSTSSTLSAYNLSSHPSSSMTLAFLYLHTHLGYHHHRLPNYHFTTRVTLASLFSLPKRNQSHLNPSQISHLQTSTTKEITYYLTINHQLESRSLCPCPSSFPSFSWETQRQTTKHCFGSKKSVKSCHVCINRFFCLTISPSSHFLFFPFLTYSLNVLLSTFSLLIRLNLHTSVHSSHKHPVTSL